MYRIEKVLNNNSILASKDNQEVIFLGKGIGFGKKINDIYIPGDGVKKYKMETKEQEKRLPHEIIRNVDPVFIEIASDIIRFAQEQFDHVDTKILLPLADHIDFVIKRIQENVNMSNPFTKDIELLFPEEYKVALKGKQLINSITGFEITEDEVGYVSLHIGAAIERCFSGSLQNKSVILVCGSGQATTRMLEARLNVFFKDKITIVRKASYNEFINYTKRELLNVDFVISTIPLKSEHIPTITVDFALNNQDIEAISKFLTSISLNKMKKSNKFFDKNLFIHLDGIDSKESLLKQMCQLMEKQNIVDSNYFDCVMERENLAKTNMNEVFALPHPMRLCAKDTKVAVAIIDKPLTWYQQDTVQIIFLLAIKQGDQQDIEHLYDIFIEIVNNTKLQQSIIHSYSFDDFMKNLYQYFQ